ncbi:ubiquitin carboxyl-terminal hydrolase 47-like [Odontesthes bonariensis]|uniref:ubiquitin carboxyl-terminal hydrolase 47-like n=1 Tax=Odontesthes bonariensis TaxID=219752 RepID=UPI003F580BA1
MYQSSATMNHGLYTQRAPTHLNCVLQVLFRTEGFREAVERHSCGHQSFDNHLKTFFDNLKREKFETCDIIKKLGIKSAPQWDEVSDAAQCFEDILRNVSTPGASQLFQGQLIHKRKCSKCGSVTRTDDPFWSLPLELVESDRDYKVEQHPVWSPAEILR